MQQKKTMNHISKQTTHHEKWKKLVVDNILLRFAYEISERLFSIFEEICRNKKKMINVAKC